MPRYSRKTFRRRTRRKSPWYRRRYNAAELAYKAYKGVKYIRGLVNSEMLHADKAYSNGSIGGSGTVAHITALSQGDTASGRTGNSILLRKINYRLKFEINAAVTSNTSVTMVIFFDKQQIGDTTPTWTDVYDSANSWSLMSLATAGRFKILQRKDITLTPASGGRPAIELKGNFNVYKHVRFNGTSGTDIQKNGLYVGFISSESTNTPIVSGTVRIGYHDN